MANKWKLGGAWTVFDSEELLEGSIAQIRDQLDLAVIVWQNISNFGNRNNELEGFVNMLAKKYDCHLLYYMPIADKGSHPNQKYKLQHMMDYMRKNEVTHCVYSATDEYYDPKQFKKAIKFMKKNGYDSAACRLYTYFHDPIYRLSPLENYWKPFVYKIFPNLVFDGTYPVRTDPSTGPTPTGRFYAFKPEELVMHHYTWVRKDISQKLNNHSLSKRYGVPELIRAFNNWEYPRKPVFFHDYDIEIVDNVFNIDVSG